MKDASGWLIACLMLLIFASAVTVFGYFFAADKDALLGGCLTFGIVAWVCWAKARKAKL
jgi:hypothetical protein